jgi:hypothetical protein
MRNSTWEVLSFAIPSLIGLIVIILAAVCR